MIYLHATPQYAGYERGLLLSLTQGLFCVILHCGCGLDVISDGTS